MKNFDYHLPVDIYFGKGQLERLGQQIEALGKRVLLAYGGGSIKRMGLYQEILAIFDQHGVTHWELDGIEPNPRVETVGRGAELCRKNQIQWILAVGGGSTMDCAKVVAAAVFYEGDPWDLVINPALIKQALPLGTVVTLAATGSEMDTNAVISNMTTKQKVGTSHQLLYPKFSILDPTYTYSVPAYQTAAGTADIMSHTFENYFTINDHAFLTSRLAEGVLETCINYAPIAIEEPENYEARANLLWASTLAINGLLRFGKACPWSVHAMEHALSAYYDITHGVGLAILTPAWMTYVLDDNTVDLFAQYGINVWKLPANEDKEQLAKEAIVKTQAFFTGLGIPERLRDVGIPHEMLAEIASSVIRGGQPIQGLKTLDTNDILAIYEMAW